MIDDKLVNLEPINQNIFKHLNPTTCCLVQCTKSLMQLTVFYLFTFHGIWYSHKILLINSLFTIINAVLTSGGLSEVSDANPPHSCHGFLFIIHKHFLKLLYFLIIY